MIIDHLWLSSSLQLTPVLLPQTENGPSTSSVKQNIPESLSKFIPRPAPALAGAYDLTDINTLLREWVTTITGIQWGAVVIPACAVACEMQIFLCGVVNSNETIMQLVDDQKINGQFWLSIYDGNTKYLLVLASWLDKTSNFLSLNACLLQPWL